MSDHVQHLEAMVRQCERTLAYAKVIEPEAVPNTFAIAQLEADRGALTSAVAEITALRARIAELEGEWEWRPIETLTHEDGRVLICAPHQMISRPAIYTGHMGPTGRICAWPYGFVDDATHWMPLPTPPGDTT